MTRDDAIAFLRGHQPLPPDRHLEKAVLDRYDEVRKFFLEHPDPESIPLFLNSFGQGSGFGVYQLIEDVIRRQPKGLVLPHLAAALQNPAGSVRYWCAQIAVEFPDPSLVGPLVRILEEDDDDACFAAAAALEQIEDSRVLPALKKTHELKSDPDLNELLAEIIDNKHNP